MTDVSTGNCDVQKRVSAGAMNTDVMHCSGQNQSNQQLCLDMITMSCQLCLDQPCVVIKLTAAGGWLPAASCDSFTRDIRAVWTDDVKAAFGGKDDGRMERLSRVADLMWWQCWPSGHSASMAVLYFRQLLPLLISKTKEPERGSSKRESGGNASQLNSL